jgi:pSer/pThr/pTyr-binding forkhead associated (FHA) protein
MSKYSLEHFLDACGATGPLRLTVEHATGTDRHLLHQPFAVVGRDPRADLRVADGSAARRHFYLQILFGRLLCLDLTKGSPDGRKQPPHRWLPPATEIRLPSTTIRLVDTPGVMSPQLPSSPQITLGITGGAAEKAELRIRHPLVLIGQAHECQVRLRDERVSRFHCALVNTPAGLWVVDLLGRGGIALNGSLVRSARFDDGDELRLGGAFTIQFRHATPQPAPEDAEPVIMLGSLAPRQTELPALIPPAAEPRPLVTLEGAGLPPTADASTTSLALAFAPLQQQMTEQFHQTMTNVIAAFREVHRDQMRMVWQELARVQQLTDELAAVKDQLHELRAESAARPRALAAPATPAGAAPTVSQNDGPAKAGHARRSPPKPAQPPEQTAPAASKRVDVHEWLSGRVDAIKKERDGRWQKIFSLLSGSSASTR